MIMQDKVNYFNTSHVTVYQRPTSSRNTVEGFQYISCYCLSMPEEIYVNQLRDFNTSHVTVYPALILQCLVDNWISIHLMLLFILISFFPFIRFVHFNTSHVTVYPVPTRFFFILFKFQYISCYCLSLSSFLLIESPLISIHLMLLFIDVGDLWTQGSSGFQYISCYCLSRRSFLVSSGSWHFNTSHVTVYP